MRIWLTDELGTRPADLAGLARKTGSTRLDPLLLALVRKPTPGAPCPACGWTREQYRSTGLLGCPLCYEVFAVGAPAEPLPPSGTSSEGGIG
ncbi:MAG: hypothetical protein IT207_06830 [Fimbriimonadaceae bacterium]|nr:hypothetical protein [Fimbriimonadaceae bacterium]